MTKVMIPLASGVEEMEAVILLDTFRRAKWEAVGVGIDGKTIVGSRRVRIIADVEWNDIEPDSFDVVAIPGGSEGTKALMGFIPLLETLSRFQKAKKPIGAICAGPLVLQAAGILDGVRATCHPAVREQLKRAQISNERVVVDGRIITSQGPGTSFEFALALIDMIDGPAPTKTVAKTMIL